MLTFLLWWIVCSYVVGLFIFMMEHGTWAKTSEPVLLKARLIILLVAPICAWHGVLHYLQVGWCKLMGRKLKFWV